MLWYIMAWYGITWFGIICYGMVRLLVRYKECLGLAMLCYAMLCSALLGYARLCYAMLGYARLCSGNCSIWAQQAEIQDWYSACASTVGWPMSSSLESRIHSKQHSSLKKHFGLLGNILEQGKGQEYHHSCPPCQRCRWWSGGQGILGIGDGPLVYIM